ncbi:MAG: hypothetical protein JXR88_03320 [Clostridia bacterium]|nr:hypothetical protein [Clostridia bacterium]
MRKIISIIVLLAVITSYAYAGGGKVQERNPEINGEVDPPVMRTLDVHGEV